MILDDPSPSRFGLAPSRPLADRLESITAWRIDAASIGPDRSGSRSRFWPVDALSSSTNRP